LVIVGPTDDPPGEDPVDDAPSVRPVDCSWNVGCRWSVPPEAQPLRQAARARGSAILRQPHASCACTSKIDISKNNCALAITTVERDTPDTPSIFSAVKKYHPRGSFGSTNMVGPWARFQGSEPSPNKNAKSSFETSGRVFTSAIRRRIEAQFRAPPGQRNALVRPSPP
jgi:hypothetical protein